MAETRTDGRCPYCGGDCFKESVEIVPFRLSPPEGEWKNKCWCGKWSVAVQVSEAVQEQRPMVQPLEEV